MISVCMATYNGEKFIKEQIDSILVQLSENDELIISDDGSKDMTQDIIKGFDDKRIKLVVNAGPHGYTPNFYNALRLAKGDVIFLSDQDDVWAKDKVRIAMSYLQKYDFVHSDAVVVNENMEVIIGSHNNFTKTKSGFLKNLLRCRYLGCCMVFNKKVLDAIFPVPCYSNAYPYDLWIALIAEKYFRCISIPEKLVLYRRHGNNASNGGVENKSHRSIARKFFDRFRYLRFVLKQNKKIRSLNLR